MKRLSVVLLLLLAAGSGAQNRTSHATASLAESIDVEALGFSAPRLDRVDGWLQDLVQRGELPGAVWLVARRGAVARLRAVGFADLETRRPMRPDAIFRLASATKIITAAALLTLYEEGRFRLNDPVSIHLPEFRDLRVFRPDGTTTPATGPITIRDLLRHTSGYGYGYRDPQQTAYRQAGLLGPGPDLDLRHDLTLAAWAARLAGVPLADEPGTRFDYGFSSDIAGLLIERLTGSRLDAALEERVLRPLGMSDTGFTVPKDRLDRLTSIYRMQDGRWKALDRAESSSFSRVPKALSGGGGWDNEGGGGLVSTAPDLFRFLQMLLNGGELDGTRVLGSKTVELMFKNHLADLATPYRSPGVGFGFGYAVLDDEVRRGEVGSRGSFWWAGSTNVHYWADPREELIGLFLSQVRPFPYQDLMETPRHLTWVAIAGPPAPRVRRGREGSSS